MRSILISAALLLCLIVLSSGCRSPNLGVNRGYDNLEDEEEYVDMMSPDGFVDRLGEPDEWKNEGSDDDLRMSAIWKCSHGKHRTVAWVIGTRERGGQGWRLVQDETRDGDCDDEGNSGPSGS